MNEGTSVGLMTVVTIVGFGILFGLMLVFMPEMRETTLGLLQDGVKSSPRP